jgi:DNA-damage-inducible protein J
MRGIKEEKQVKFSINMDAQDKKLAEKLFRSLGLNMTTAMNAFIKQAIRLNGLPFEIRNSNEERRLEEKASGEDK